VLRGQRAWGLEHAVVAAAIDERLAA